MVIFLKLLKWLGILVLILLALALLLLLIVLFVPFRYKAAAEVDDPNSVFSYYRKLIELRHEMPIIVYGSYEPLLEDDPTIWAYRRELDGKTITVACNYSDAEVPCDLFDGAGERLIGNYAEHKDGVLQPYEAYVVIA